MATYFENRALLRFPSLWDIFLCAAFFAPLFIWGNFVADPGVGWHLRTGEIIFQTKQVPVTDPFTWYSEGNGWVCNQWLSDLLFYLLYRAGGFPILHLTVAVLGLLALAVIVHYTLRTSRPSLPRLLHPAVVTIVLYFGAVQWILRPIVFSLLLFSLLLLWRAARRPYFYMVPLFLIWANIHPAFILGLVALAVFVIMDFIEGKRGVLLFAMGAAAITLINPRGWHLHQEILRLGRSSFFMTLNSEWLPPDRSLIIFYLFATIVPLFQLFALARGDRRAPAESALILPFLFQATRHIRYIPFFALSAAPIIGDIFYSLGIRIPLPEALRNGFASLERKEKVRSQGEWFLLALALCFGATFYSGHLPGKDASFSSIEHHKSYPSVAFSYIEDYEKYARWSPGRIFHTPDWGGYITWRSFPQKRAYLDDRNEVHGEQAYRDYLTIARGDEGWERLLQENNFRWALLRLTDPVLTKLQNSPQWKQLFTGANSVVFVRKEASLP